MCTILSGEYLNIFKHLCLFFYPPLVYCKTYKLEEKVFRKQNKKAVKCCKFNYIYYIIYNYLVLLLF